MADYMHQLLPLTTHPNSLLHLEAKALSVSEILSEDIQNLIRDMIPTMYANNGVGLAAPQVGRSIQLCTIGAEYVGKKAKALLKNSNFPDLVLINPRYEIVSNKTQVDTEGCLSVPKRFGDVKRYKHVVVTALNDRGETITFPADNFFACIVQHETDHLRGTLFIQKATNLFTAD